MSEPLISILLPSRTRGGVCGAVKFITAANDLAADKANVEFILRFDFDDAAALAMTESFGKFGNVRVIVGHRFDGYHNLHIFANECAALSSGRWLGFFNDDAWMVTPRWDEKLLAFEQNHPATVPYVCFATVDMPAETPPKQLAEFRLGPRYDFPIVSRAAYTAAGCWCPMPVLDWYWYDAYHALPKLGGDFITDWIACHDYARWGRIACCDEELCAQRYRTPEFQAKKQECFDRIAKVL